MTARDARVAMFTLSLATGFAVRAEPPPLTAVHTAEQAAAGQATYESFCIACHQADLGGQNEALPLKGEHFYASWGQRTTHDLFNFISTSMPPGQSILNEEQYLGLIAYLLQSNGATSGSQALNAATSVPIRAIVPSPKGQIEGHHRQ